VSVCEELVEDVHKGWVSPVWWPPWWCH